MRGEYFKSPYHYGLVLRLSVLCDLWFQFLDLILHAVSLDRVIPDCLGVVVS